MGLKDWEGAGKALGDTGVGLGDTGVTEQDWGWTDRHWEEPGRHWGLSPCSHRGLDVPGGSLRGGSAPTSAHVLCEGRKLRAGVCDEGGGEAPLIPPPPK